MNKKGFVEEFVIFAIVSTILVLCDALIFSSPDLGGLIGIGFWFLFGLVYLFWAKGLFKFFLGVLPILLACSSIYFSIPFLEILGQGELLGVRSWIIVVVVLSAVIYAKKIVKEKEMARNNSMG